MQVYPPGDGIDSARKINTKLLLFCGRLNTHQKQREKEVSTAISREIDLSSQSEIYPNSFYIPSYIESCLNIVEFT